MVLILSCTDEGAEKFKTATEEAYKNNHDTIAIYYDGSLISVPSVNAVMAFYLWLAGEARKHIIAGDFATWKPMMVKRVSTRL